MTTMTLARCAACALNLSLALPATAAHAEDSIYVPLFTYRTGPFAGSGVIWRISRETIQPGFPIGISFVPGRVNTALGGAGTVSGVQSGGASGIAKKF